MKRTSLKALSGLTALAAIPPGIASASAMLDSESTTLGNDVTLSMVPGHGRRHSVKLSNTGNKPVTLKHVYPGIVSVDGNSYNLNSLFNNGPVVIEAGESQVLVVAKQDASLPENKIPQNLSRSYPFSLGTEYQHFGKAKSVTTTRQFFT